MWFIVIAALVIVGVALALLTHRSRRARPSFGKLSREDQVHSMRNRQGGDARAGSHEVVKNQASRHTGNHFGTGIGGGY